MPARVAFPRTRNRALPILAGLNVAVFVAWQAAASSSPAWLPWMEANFLVSRDLVFRGHVWTLLTSAFSHLTVNHLFFNLLALQVFGSDVERVVGSRGFVHLYVAGGVVASLGHVLYGALVGTDVPALGASGAVMSIAVVSAHLFPNRQLLLFFIIPMRQYVAVALFLLLDVLGLVSPGSDMIAHAAHLGGAVYGWVWMTRWGRTYIQQRLEALGLKPQRRMPAGWDGHPPA